MKTDTFGGGEDPDALAELFGTNAMLNKQCLFVGATLEPFRVSK